MTISTIFLHLHYSSGNIICIKVVFSKIRGILIAKIYIIPSSGESLLMNNVTGYVNKFCLIYLLSVFIVPSIEIRPAHPIHFKIEHVTITLTKFSIILYRNDNGSIVIKKMVILVLLKSIEKSSKKRGRVA